MLTKGVNTHTNTSVDVGTVIALGFLVVKLEQCSQDLEVSTVLGEKRALAVYGDCRHIDRSIDQ